MNVLMNLFILNARVEENIFLNHQTQQSDVPYITLKPLFRVI